MEIETALQVFKDDLGEILSAEQTFLEGMEQMTKKAQSEEVRSALEVHMRETEWQIENLNRAFEALGESPAEVECYGAEGLAKRYQIEAEKTAPKLIDSVTISAQSRVEHFEIGFYESLIVSAEKMGNPEVVELLQRNLEQEKKTAEKMQRLNREMS